MLQVFPPAAASAETGWTPPSQLGVRLLLRCNFATLTKISPPGEQFCRFAEEFAASGISCREFGRVQPRALNSLLGRYASQGGSNCAARAPP